MTKDQELWYKLTVLKPEYYDILDYDVESVTENHYNDVLLCKVKPLQENTEIKH